MWSRKLQPFYQVVVFSLFSWMRVIPPVRELPVSGNRLLILIINDFQTVLMIFWKYATDPIWSKMATNDYQVPLFRATLDHIGCKPKFSGHKPADQTWQTMPKCGRFRQSGLKLPMFYLRTLERTWPWEKKMGYRYIPTFIHTAVFHFSTSFCRWLCRNRNCGNCWNCTYWNFMDKEL